MIRTENLTKQFDSVPAVDRLTLEIAEGEVFAFLGPNGAGKTTTVRMLSAILRPTAGGARVAGYDVVRQPDAVRAAVGVLTEHHGLYLRMRAREYLDFVYLGNIGRENNTHCPECNNLLIKRRFFGATDVKIQNGRCRFCKTEIPGIWL